MSELLIRTYEPSDRASVVRLWTEVFPDDPPRNAPELMIDQKKSVQPELFFVALLDGRMVGAVMAGYEGTRGWIHHLAVTAEHRGAGIGRALMEKAEEGLAELGCPKVNLQVRARNRAVVEFYQQVGYQVEDLVSMGKMLGMALLIAATALTTAAPLSAQRTTTSTPSLLLRTTGGVYSEGISLGAELGRPLSRNIELLGAVDVWVDGAIPACIGQAICRDRNGFSVMGGARASTRGSEPWWFFAQGMAGGFRFQSGPVPWVPSIYGRAGLAVGVGAVVLEGAGQWKWVGEQSSVDPLLSSESWSGVTFGVSLGL